MNAQQKRPMGGDGGLAPKRRSRPYSAAPRLSRGHGKHAGAREARRMKPRYGDRDQKNGPLRDVHGKRETSEFVNLSPLNRDTIRVIPLGGVEEVGRNMMVVELAEGIIVVDAGFQFVSEDVTPAVDY